METTAGSQLPLRDKKVLYAITKSNGGGAQQYVLMLAKAARDAGADVVVAAGSGSGNGGGAGILLTELKDAGIRTIELNHIRRDLGIADEWRAFTELVRIVRGEKPDVLHLNSSKMGLLGGLAGRIGGAKRIIFTAHGWPHKEQRPLLWKLMAWTGSWLTVVLSHRIICVSENDLRSSPILLFRDQLALVHNGMEDFQRKGRDEARAQLAALAPGISRYSHLLLMNAELHPNKGVSTAIRALAELHKTHQDLALVVCGEGQERARLEALADSLHISDRVFLLGFIPNARELLPAGDIYLMPSRKEGLPLALLEAGLAGLPVVASRVGGIPEIITDKETGLFMPRSNTHILAASIHHLLAHAGEAAEFGARLRAQVREKFSAEQMTSRTFALY